MDFPAREIPTTRGSSSPEMLAQTIPDQAQGVSSPSFQSEKAEEGWSTADFRARSARPSEESESTGMKLNKT